MGATFLDQRRRRHRTSGARADGCRARCCVADAHHTQSDLFTSATVIAALVGVKLGYPLLDPTAAIVVAGFIGYACWEIFRETTRILADEIVIAADDIRAVVLGSSRSPRLPPHPIARIGGSRLCRSPHLDGPRDAAGRGASRLACGQGPHHGAISADQGRGDSHRAAALEVTAAERRALGLRIPHEGATMSVFLADLRHGLRQLRRQPLFAAAAIGSLALGIGLNTTLFSVVNAVLFREGVVTAPDQLVEIYSGLSKDFPQLTTSYPDYQDIRSGTTALAEHRWQRVCAGHSFHTSAGSSGHGRSGDLQLLRCARHSIAAWPRIPP